MIRQGIAALLLTASAAAHAQGSNAQGSAVPGDEDRPWTLSASGGITAIQAQTDQPFASIGIRRSFDDSWVKLEGSWVGSGEASGSTIPADTLIGSFSAGTYVGNLGLDAYILAGPRRFDEASFRSQTGTTINVDRSGSIFGLGGGISYDVPLSERLFVTPFVGVDYTRLDFAIALFNPAGRPVGARKDASDGVTGTAGVSLSQLFANDGGSIGVSAAFNTASNIAAVGQIGRTTSTSRAAPRFAIAPDEGGNWGEIGGTLSFNISRDVAVDLSILQTISFPFGDTTAGTVGLRFRL